MSQSPAQPDASEIDDLVAYLDGELSADDCRRVERRLANDADYRRQLTELERAWTALDSLPATTVDDDFARTTIEMVCVAADHDLKQSAATRSTAALHRRLWLIAGGVALTLVAFGATWWLAPSRDQILVADLPVVARLDVLSDVGDSEFLRGLAKFDFDAPTRNAMNDVADSSPVEWETFDERRAWIEALPAGDKAELAGRLERYRRETPESRDQLLELVREIEAASDRNELESTLSAYGAWLQTRTPAERAELRGLPAEKRLSKIKQLLDRSQRSPHRKLSFEDEQTLQRALLTLVHERRRDLVDAVRQRGDPDAEERLGQRSVSEVAMLVFWRDMWDEQQRQQLADRLVAPLSDEIQSYFDELDNRQKFRQLADWVVEALGSNIRPQNLEEFFASDSLTNDQREYLLGLPRAEMEQRLQQLYLQSRVGLRQEGPPRWFFRGRGPRDREGDWDGPEGRRGPPRDRGERFDGPPGRRGPNGDLRPDRPPGPPPRDRDRRPPPPDEERPFRPPPPE